MNKLLIAGFLVFCSLRSFSTCIAIYVAPNGHIYVAADSRRTFLFDDDKSKYQSICKIHHVGNTYFAIAGFDDGGLLTAANSALTENRDADSAITAFCTIMTARYQYLMKQTQQFYPDRLQQFVKDGLCEVSFFGYVNDKPKVQDIQFRVHLKKGQVVISYALQPVGYITVIGISKDIDNAPPDELPGKQIMLQEPELYVEELVKYEAGKQPLAVGEPIDLLELKPDGAVWIRKNKDEVTY